MVLGVNFSLHHNLEYIEFFPRIKVGHLNFSHPFHNWTSSVTDNEEIYLQTES
jgi:hypothetical protein